jgi:phosphoribosylformylglycinamidine synthase subunit PurL
MGQFVGCVRGISEACRALDFPVVSGNVSLYNETNGRAIPPTPSIGGVGLLADFTGSATLAFKAAGEAILLVGSSQGWLGQSLYLRDICGREEGAPPPVDLAAERRNGDFVRALIERKVATAVHDVSDGGLAVAVAEMAMAAGIGADLQAAFDAPPPPYPPPQAGEGRVGAASTGQPPDSFPHPAFWFGEDQARYVVTVRNGDVAVVLELAGINRVPARRIGTTGGNALTLPGQRPILVVTLSERFESWLPGYMSGGDQGSGV